MNDKTLNDMADRNRITHDLDELLYESCFKKDLVLFKKLIELGADVSWRRCENDCIVNLFHYIMGNNLKTFSVVALNSLIEQQEFDIMNELLNEENYEGKTPIDMFRENKRQ